VDSVEEAGASRAPSDSAPEVEAAVREAIAHGGGKITFARFVEICLYHEARGYYAAFAPAGAEGGRSPASDYFTSVDLHPAFGRLIARELALHLERALRGGAARVFAVEIGGGRGLLARDILQGLAAESPPAYDRLTYLLVEPNAGSISVQQRNLLPEFAGKVAWMRSAGVNLPLRKVAGAIVSNELLDALPFHVLEGVGEAVGAQATAGLAEVFVAARGGATGLLQEVVGPVSDPRLLKRLDDEGVGLAPGQRGEVSLDAEALAFEMGRALAVGAVLIVDYGDEAAGLYDVRRRPEGTLRCFFRHRLNDEPLARLGRQDITVHVDFTAVSRAVERAGLRVQRVERQGEFLDRHGLSSFVAKLDADQPRIGREAFVRHRRALEALRDPRGLGSNLVLVAWR